MDFRSSSTPPAPPLAARIEIRMGLAFWAVAGTCAVVCGAAERFAPFAVPVAALVVVWPLVRRSPVAGTVLDWLPLPLVVLTYEMLHAVAPACFSFRLDPWLRDVDRAVFGTDVARLLEAWVEPGLTRAMSTFYGSYYLMPLCAGIWWYRRNRTAFRELMVGEAGALFIGYLGYLFLPAEGPHAALGPHAFPTGPLVGDFTGDWIRSLNVNHGGAFPTDAFPSLHTANAVTILLVGWRQERRVAWIYLLPVAGLVAATMYLRFHYAIDVVVGALLAVAWQRFVPGLVAVESADP